MVRLVKKWGCLTGGIEQCRGTFRGLLRDSRNCLGVVCCSFDDRGFESEVPVSEILGFVDRSSGVECSATGGLWCVRSCFRR